MELDRLRSSGKSLRVSAPSCEARSKIAIFRPCSHWKPLFTFTQLDHRRTLTIAIITGIGSGALFPILAIFLGYIFSAFSDYGANRICVFVFVSRVSLYARYLCVFAMASWILHVSFFASSQTFGDLQAVVAQTQTFNGMLLREMAWFDHHNFGARTLGSVQSRIREVHQATSLPLGSVLQLTSMALVATAVALYTAWDLTLVILAIIPVSTFALKVLSDRLRLPLRNYASERDVSAAITKRAVSAIQIVKCYDGKKFEIQQYTQSLRRASQYFIQQARVSALQIGFVRFISLAIFVQGFWYGSSVVASGSLTAGDILTVFWACLISIYALQEILLQLIILEKGKVATEKLRKISPEPIAGQKLKRKALSNTKSFLDGDVRLSNVSFTYPGQRTSLSLDGVNMFFPRGEMTFITGKSGSGKSTLANAMLGLYKFSGNISVNGEDIFNLNDRQLRNNITLVHQQPQLFSDNLLRNIALGSRDTEDVGAAEVQECVAFAGLEDTIAQLPQGLWTPSGRFGNALSGGQKQRVALARARLRNTPILILDEATSALDRRTAERVMANIRSWRRKKTTIIITHDLTQIQPQDYLYVLKDGRVVQEGYRSALENSSIGPFHELSSYQGRDHHSLAASPEENAPGPSQRRLRSTELDPESLVNVRSAPSFKAKPDRKLQFNSIFRHHSRIDRHPERSAMQVLRTVWHYLDREHRFKLVGGLLLAGVHATATPAFSLCFSKLLGTFSYQAESGCYSVSTWSFIIFMVAFLDAIASYFMHLYLECCSQFWVDSFRREAFHRILDQSCSWFDKKAHGAHRLGQCLDQEAEEMKTLLSRFASSIFVAVVMMLIAATGAFIVCWELTLVGLVVAAPMFAIVKFFRDASQRWERKSNDALQTADFIFTETFTNIQTVKSYTLEQEFRVRHVKALSEAARVAKKKTVASGILYGSSDAGVILIIAFLFWSGSLLVLYDESTVQSIITVFSMLIFTLTSVNRIVSQLPQLNVSLESANHLLHLVNLPQTAPARSAIPARESSADPDSITITKLSFTYPSRFTQPVFKNINLSIPFGTSTAVTGPSGCGKSTLLAILAGLYAPDPPATSNMAESPPFTLPYSVQLSDIILSPQSPPIFPTTICANIAYALDSSHPLAREANILRAAEEAGLGAFIFSLQDGLETRVGEGGIGLSGGQRIRLGLARAICRRPKVLLLDEPTAGLDGGAKREFVEFVKSFVAGEDDDGGGMSTGQGQERTRRTIVVVSHDPEVIAGCERVVRLG